MKEISLPTLEIALGKVGNNADTASDRLNHKHHERGIALQEALGLIEKMITLSPRAVREPRRRAAVFQVQRLDIQREPKGNVSLQGGHALSLMDDPCRPSARA